MQELGLGGRALGGGGSWPNLPGPAPPTLLTVPRPAPPRLQWEQKHKYEYNPSTTPPKYLFDPLMLLEHVN